MIQLSGVHEIFWYQLLTASFIGARNKQARQEGATSGPALTEATFWEIAMADEAHSTTASGNRRLFLKNVAALSTVGAVGVFYDLSVLGGTLTPDEIARCTEVARCASVMRYLDERGAVYEALPQRGWYRAIWSDPSLGSGPIPWTANVETNDLDHLYARAFRAKVEGLKNF